MVLAFLTAWLLVASMGVHAKEQIAFTKEGITVWKVPVANSKMIGFKAQGTVDAPINSVFATIIDIDRASEWLPNIGQIRALEKRLDGQGASKLYFVINMPFPLTDRHLAVKSSFVRDAKGAITISNVVDNAVKLSGGDMVRITDYRGNWKLEPLGTGQTRVTIDGFADPAGGIPSWVANMFVTKQPFDMLKNMKTQAKKPRYKDFVIKF